MNRSSALELLPTLQPEGSVTEATELCTVWPPELAGVVVVPTGDTVVGTPVVGGRVVGTPVVGGRVVGAAVAGGEVVGAPVAGGNVVGAAVAGGEVEGAVVAGGEAVVAGDGTVVGVAPVVLGLPGVVVVLTLPPGAALGTVVGLGLWEINLGTTRPAIRASTKTPATATPIPTALRRPRWPTRGRGTGARRVVGPSPGRSAGRPTGRVIAARHRGRRGGNGGAGG